jgi:hypothetical protein
MILAATSFFSGSDHQPGQPSATNGWKIGWTYEEWAVTKMSYSLESERRLTNVAQSITWRSISKPIASSGCL